MESIAVLTQSDRISIRAVLHVQSTEGSGLHEATFVNFSKTLYLSIITRNLIHIGIMEYTQVVWKGKWKVGDPPEMGSAFSYEEFVYVSPPLSPPPLVFIHLVVLFQNGSRHQKLWNHIWRNFSLKKKLPIVSHELPRHRTPGQRNI